MKKAVIISSVVVLLVAAVIITIGSFSLTGQASSYDYIEGKTHICTDSDGHLPLAESYLVKGAVTRELVSSGEQSDFYEDECISNLRLKEYRCILEAKVKAKKRYCENGCQDGVCL
tara:strand:+ start:3020 stop:3367 length:348 start_codon:yes stop_codon:yes gene_type:complete